jgi:hypothetical protein
VLQEVTQKAPDAGHATKSQLPGIDPDSHGPPPRRHGD